MILSRLDSVILLTRPWVCRRMRAASSASDPVSFRSDGGTYFAVCPVEGATYGFSRARFGGSCSVASSSSDPNPSKPSWPSSDESNSSPLNPSSSDPEPPKSSSSQSSASSSRLESSPFSLSASGPASGCARAAAAASAFLRFWASHSSASAFRFLLSCFSSSKPPLRPSRRSPNPSSLKDCGRFFLFFKPSFLSKSAISASSWASLSLTDFDTRCFDTGSSTSSSKPSSSSSSPKSSSESSSSTPSERRSSSSSSLSSSSSKASDSSSLSSGSGRFRFNIDCGAPVLASFFLPPDCSTLRRALVLRFGAARSAWWFRTDVTRLALDCVLSALRRSFLDTTCTPLPPRPFPGFESANV